MVNTINQRKYGLRTFSRLSLSYYSTISTTTDDVTTTSIVRIPLGMIVAPGTLSVDHGRDIQELLDKNCFGETVVGFTYPNGIKPQISIEMSTASPDFDSLLHGRLMGTQTDVAGAVYFEIAGTQTSFPALASGDAGYEVAAQGANEYPEIYYINPDTKLATQLSIIESSAEASTLTGNQIQIQANLAINISPTLASSGYFISGWVPATFAAATIITPDIIDTVSVKAMGIDFNGNAAYFMANQCSLLAGGPTAQDPKRQAKLQILPDPTVSNGLGYQMIYLNELVVC